MVWSLVLRTQELEPRKGSGRTVGGPILWCATKIRGGGGGAVHSVRGYRFGK